MSRIAEAAFGDLFYPLAPGFKTGGTSKNAARAIAGDAKLLREQAYSAIVAAGSRGLTADEVAEKLGCSVLSIRPRCSELRTAGRIVPSGDRRKNVSGLRAAVWRVA
jgi:DNA-directed RNA polymerase specialized sigma24 family protein